MERLQGSQGERGEKLGLLIAEDSKDCTMKKTRLLEEECVVYCEAGSCWKLVV